MSIATTLATAGLLLLTTLAHAADAYPPLVVQQADGTQKVYKYKATRQCQPESKCQSYNGPYPVYGGRLGKKETTSAYGPYTTNCSGSHQFGFTTHGVNATIILLRLGDRGWEEVSRSSYGYLNEYNRQGGTYQVMISTSGKLDSWALNVTTPGY